MNDNEYISVLKFCRERKIDRQKVYRMIREHKLEKDKDYKLVEKVVNRLHIRKDLYIL